MKKTVFILIVSLVSVAVFPQSSPPGEKYTKAMEKLVPSIDTLWNGDGLRDLSNSFERIADAEKTQWLPYYYAALARVNAGYTLLNGSNAMGGNADKTDPDAKKAEELLNKAEELSKDNSEIFVVRKMIAILYLVGDPMNRYMTYGPAASQALETARKLNPENPRVYLQEGLDKYTTPEQYGGNKEEGKKILEEAIKKYEAFKPESSIHPNWGLNLAKRFIAGGQ
ncbi:MAG: hypothetical protein Q8941_15815 [Bacteroidota bacterium]|nr:hypothetical protein [Bacteroidota bacterium]